MLFSTLIGGSHSDYATALALDSANNVYITGSTGSSDFPTLNAYDNVLLQPPDVFVCKLASDQDGDGIADEREIAIGTNPSSNDTDADGMPDGVEVASGFDPLNPLSNSFTPLLLGVLVIVVLIGTGISLSIYYKKKRSGSQN